MPSREVDVASLYADGDEVLRLAFSAYTAAGLGRRVVGVTDRRLIVVRSRYWSPSDKGLLWADSLDDVALVGRYVRRYVNSGNTGNAYLRIRRADGSILELNPRSSFIGRTASAEENIQQLYSLVRGRY